MPDEKAKEEHQVKTDTWGQPEEHGGKPVYETIEKDTDESQDNNEDQSK